MLEFINFLKDNQWTLHLITISVSSFTLLRVNQFISNQSTKGDWVDWEEVGF